MLCRSLLVLLAGLLLVQAHGVDLSLQKRQVAAKSYPPCGTSPPFDPAWSTFLSGALDTGADITACGNSKTWSLTYDDGPSEYTPGLLDQLDTVGVKTTFFVIGCNVANNPSILRRAYQAGHQIGIHTWTHPSLPKLTSEQIVAEIMWTAKIIRDITGQTPTYMRPPYGDIDARVRGLLHKMGLKVVIWNRDTDDWELQTFNPNAQNSSQVVTPTSVRASISSWIASPPAEGIISLEHDLFQLPAQIAGETLQRVSMAGFNINTVASCVGTAPYNNTAIEVIFNPAIASSLSKAPSTTASASANSTATLTASKSPSSSPSPSAGSIRASLDWSIIGTIALVLLCSQLDVSNAF
ncbi:uncharacterized protein BJ171DRAFT_484536 [Polychytrium aggregatum]|uniref:uncharacterized protein n=1 Tax=Polychytrium aggregatum TaxID=110093 RepID=UPI0022FDC464|nr:uncharacterized protein BJ171DRAFT_484536 [Polychytrium aggregatum]KAI9209611.1 hypothetical protein BJ171DRAFT_484536 [Polychytrium aggregatum]